MKKTLIGLCSVALSCALAFAQASTSPPSPPSAAQMAAHEVARLTQFLSLTADQKTQATAILTTKANAETSLRSSMETAHKALQTAVVANDAGGISAAATKIGELTAQEVQAHATADAALYAILTPDQQTKFASMLSHGPRGFGPPGGGPMGRPIGPGIPPPEE